MGSIPIARSIFARSLLIEQTTAQSHGFRSMPVMASPEGSDVAGIRCTSRSESRYRRCYVIERALISSKCSLMKFRRVAPAGAFVNFPMSRSTFEQKALSSADAGSTSVM